MMASVRNYIVLILLCSSASLVAQEYDIDLLVDSVYNSLSRVQAYSATATFDVDIEFINMPQKTAQISFEAPDKYDVESDGFLMIPKVGYEAIDKSTRLNKIPARG